MNDAEQYPQGKLNDSDEGAMAMAIGMEKGNVVMHFKSPVVWIGFPPEQAIELAQSLIKFARKAGCKTPLKIEL